MLPGWFVGLVGLVLLRLLGMFECRFLYQPPVSLSSLSIFGHTASNSQEVIYPPARRSLTSRILLSWARGWAVPVMVSRTCPTRREPI